MKRLFTVFLALGLVLSLAAPAFCNEKPESSRDYDYDYPMMGPGYGMGMGPGYGMGPGWMMDDDHHGWGMPGVGRPWHQRSRSWKSMKPEQLEKWEKMRASYLMETLELRKKLAAKRTELQTLWAQPSIDRAKVEKLSNELAELYAERSKKRNQHLVRCREEFGDQGWPCPGGMW